jgi:hypothetical protein
MTIEFLHPTGYATVQDRHRAAEVGKPESVNRASFNPSERSDSASCVHNGVLRSVEERLDKRRRQRDSEADEEPRLAPEVGLVERPEPDK